jgi:uncharacterized membrane protein
MDDDKRLVRGILWGLLFAIPLWVLIVLVSLWVGRAIAS